MLSETTISRSSLPSPSQVGRNEALRASAQSNRIARLAQPNAALQDLQEEVSFAFSERLEKRNAEQEKAQERSQKLLREFAQKIQKGHVVDDKTREPLERKIEQKMQFLARNEVGARESQAMWQEIWQETKDLSGDKAALFAAFDGLRQKSEARGDSVRAEGYAAVAERCALTFESSIRTTINLGVEIRAFAEQHDVQAEKVLDAYRSSVADYSGILHAALELTETLGLEKSEAGAAFIRQSAGKEIALLEPSVSPEQLLHVLAELKGLQVLATVKEQVSQHREAMTRSEDVEQSEKLDGGQTKSTTASNAPSHSGIAALSDESLVKGVFHSAVAPQSFSERLDAPASRAYNDLPSGLVRHFQGLHKIFKSLPDYAFVGRIEKQRALLPLETRLDALVAREREAVL